MAIKFNHTSDFTKLLIILQFCLLSYLLYTLTLSIYKNYQIDRHIEAFDFENRRLEDANLQIASDIEYFTSSAYIEKIAKQNFGVVNPGEEVIVVPKEELDGFEEITTGKNTVASNVSNVEIWSDYLFGVR